MKCGKSFIGQQVIFDSEHPEYIEIGDYCAITMRCILLTHYVVPRGSYHDYEYGKIKIGNNVFLGANTVITKSVTIGDNVIVGAGSIVTKDIPSNEIWAGVPARFIKKAIIPLFAFGFCPRDRGVCDFRSGARPCVLVH